MTYPRSHLVDPAGGVYHVCSRCVRRAFLCGTDEVSGRDFNHRRAWLEARILDLGQIFAVELFGYAVMSSHYHLVLQTMPEVTHSWSNEDFVDTAPSQAVLKYQTHSLHDYMAYMSESNRWTKVLLKMIHANTQS